MRYKILWCYDYHVLPLAGLASDNKGVKLWFIKKDESYLLFQVEKEFLEKVEKEHQLYCEKMNKAYYHGDPRPASKPKVQTGPMSLEEIGSPTTTMETFRFDGDANLFFKDKTPLKTITPKDFSNFLVAHES